MIFGQRLSVHQFANRLGLRRGVDHDLCDAHLKTDFASGLPEKELMHVKGRSP
jgi:hypothetical protein